MVVNCARLHFFLTIVYHGNEDVPESYMNICKSQVVEKMIWVPHFFF